VYPDQRKIEIWGDEYILIEATTVPDTAKYTVESIFDPDVRIVLANFDSTRLPQSFKLLAMCLHSTN
jgi:hypothetical protein